MATYGPRMQGAIGVVYRLVPDFDKAAARAVLRSAGLPARLPRLSGELVFAEVNEDGLAAALETLRASRWFLDVEAAAVSTSHHSVLPSRPPKVKDSDGLTEWDTVEYAGDEDGEHAFYRGHPGRVIDTGLWPSEVAVGFVNRPSVCLRPEDLRPITESEYVRRGRRLVACRHPLDDRDVPRFNAEGHEWIDGREPQLGHDS